jgi:NAD-dependent glycerol-3-phosphate dehydrogenase N-terminus
MRMRLAWPISVLPQIPHRVFLCNFPPRRVPLTRPSLPSTNLVYTPTTYVHTLSRSFRMPSSSPSPKGKILVLGAGNFGSCLADHLGNSEHEVFMWSRERSVINYFNEHHKNPQYLKDHCFPRTVCAVGPDLPDAEFVKRMDVLLFAIPTQGLRYSFPRVHLSSVNMYDVT